MEFRIWGRILGDRANGFQQDGTKDEEEEMQEHAPNHDPDDMAQHEAGEPPPVQELDSVVEFRKLGLRDVGTEKKKASSSTIRIIGIWATLSVRMVPGKIFEPFATGMQSANAG